MHWEQKVQYATLSDVGMRRKNNQDSFTVQLCSDKDEWAQRGHIFIVADGMGGHAVGELASKIAVDTTPLTYFKSRAGTIPAAVTEAIRDANRVINDRGTQNPDFLRMGTTIVALILSPEGAYLAHVGDSRCYRVRSGQIELLTFDHSLEWEMRRAGRLKPGDVFLPEARHVITRSLGPEPNVEVEVDGPFEVFPGDRFILCSDGLTGHLNDSEIGMIVGSLPPPEATKLLVNLANLRGGSDNITVVIASAGDVPAGAKPPTPPSPSPWKDGDESQVGPFWQMFFWLSFLVLLIGAVMLVTTHYIPGTAFASVGVVGLIIMMRQWFAAQKETSSEDPAMLNASSHATSKAKITGEFLSRLARLENELRELSNVESWEVDWSAHEQAIAAARSALDAKQSARATSELGKALDILSVGLHQHRKKLKIAQMNAQNGNNKSNG